MKLLAIIIVALFALPLQAAWTDCICVISGPQYGGSGTLVAVAKNGHGLVISAAHVFEDGNTHDILCVFPAVKVVCDAKILAVDSRHDIAALDIAKVPKVELPAGIVAGQKADGPYVCAGFPWDSRHALRWTRGAFVGYDGATLLTRQTVRSGFSGGGRFNRFGEYVGPISGMRGEGDAPLDQCWGCSGPAMLAFVGRFVKLEK